MGSCSDAAVPGKATPDIGARVLGYCGEVPCSLDGLMCEGEEIDLA